MNLNSMKNVFSSYGLVLALVALIVGFSIALPETFPTSGTFQTMISSQAVLLLLALAVTIPLRSGDFDLSVASVMIFSAAVCGVLTTQHGVPLGAAMVIAVVIGAAIGAINGMLIVGVGISAFITTLGTMTLVGGLTYAVTDTQVITGLPDTLVSLTTTKVIGLPLSVIYGWVIAVVLWWVFQRTAFGRYLLFVGGNADASRLAGLPVSRTRFMAFVLSGTLSAFAGLVLVGRLGAVDPSIGPQYLLPPYAAAFLGTTAVQVGRFNVVGTVIALYLLIVGVTGLQLLGAEPWISDVFNGAALIAAVTFAHLTRRRMAR